MRDTATPVERLPPSLPVELMLWLSPAFPVGAFAYSHGLEYAAAHLGVTSREALEDWMGALVAHGALRNDLIFVAEAWRATGAHDWPRLASVNDLALALQPSVERHLETTTQGNAFVDAILASWPATMLADAVAGCTRGGTGDHTEIAYPVAVAAATAAHGIACDAVLFGYATAFVSNLVSAAVRLSVVGQTDAQRLIAKLLPAVRGCAECAATQSLDDIGAAAFFADLASMLHETQYSRLFRS